MTLQIIDTVERAKAFFESGNAEDAMALAESAQSEIDDIECNYMELIKRSICSIKKAASKAEVKGDEEAMGDPTENKDIEM